MSERGYLEFISGERKGDRVDLGASNLVGRGPDAQIRLPDHTVSRHHARIVVDARGATLENLSRRNPVRIDGEPVGAPVRLQHGAIVQLGRVQARYGVDHKPAARSETDSAHETPHAAQGGPETKQLALAPRMTIGRGRANAVLLNHPQVSRFHARVDRTAHGYVISDLGSTNGTFVNGRRIERHRIRPGDIIQIGAYRLSFDLDHGFLTQQSQMAAVRVDALHLTHRVPGKPEPLLKDVSLAVYPGEFVALVGGSGAGKTTLMKALNGFQPATRGRVRINGDDLYTHFDAYRSIIGYVPQDNIVHADLTVRQTLDFAARLRLPTDTTPVERARRIDTVLRQLDMAEHQGKLVKMLSGGQVKRVNIAVELLAEPPLLFLDEPTSGLDPGLEKQLMKDLRSQSDHGRTIVLVTHATANISECDHVAFISQGRLCYFGPPETAPAFFETTGGGERRSDDAFAEIYIKLQHQSARDWEHRYERSEAFQEYVARRLNRSVGHALTSNGHDQPPRGRQLSTPRASPVRQWWILVERYFELLRHDLKSMIILVGVMPMLGVFLSFMSEPDALTLKGAEAIKAIVADKGGYLVAGGAQRLLLILSLAAVLLGIFAAVYELSKERSIYRRERGAGISIAAYLSSKITVLLGFGFVQIALLMLVVMARVQLPDGGLIGSAVLDTYITLLLATLAGICCGLLISALANQMAATYVVLVVVFMQILFSGALFELDGGARLASQLTFSHWTLDGLGSVANIGSMVDAEQIEQTIEIPKGSGQKQKVAIKPETKLHIKYQHEADHLRGVWGVLGGYAAGFMALAYVALKRQNGG
ncbi:MAG: FHA domain-containing protein [Chloroflexi bacterium]|nr:FHA domain-containing protein [Chloroflexota bacterium]